MAISDDCDCAQPQTTYNDNAKQTNQYETALYLKKINWRYGEVNFNLSDRLDLKGDKHYNEITIATKGADGINRITKSFSLYTSYFEADGINTVNPNYYLNYNYRRLKLDSVGIYGMRNYRQSIRGNLESPPYKFNYITNKHLPHKDSKRRDLWGYYNGVFPETYDGIPTLKSNSRTDRYRVSNIDHDTGGINTPSLKDYAQAYLLNNITYPTGGSATFSYQLHDFYFLGKKTTGGGLRLVKKNVIEGDGNVINTDYTYKDANETYTSGYANYIPAYGYVCSANSNFDNTNSAKWYRSSSRLDNPTGVEIGYSRVVEKITGKGKTEYLFTSSKEYPDELQTITQQQFNFCNDYIGRYDRFPFVNNTSYAHRRGLLQKTNYYKETGGTLIHSITNHYKFKSLNIEPIEFKLNLISGTSPWVDVYTAGNIYSEFVYNEKTITYLDGVTKTETYNYDENTLDLRSNYLYLTDLNANPAKAYVTKYKYPYDFLNNANYQKLVDQNRKELVEQNQFVFEGKTTDPQATDFTQIDGVRYNYNATKNKLGPYVSEKFRYEMTWGNNPATDPNEWKSIYKIHQYDFDLGKPTKITDSGWSDTTCLNYTNTGKLDNLKYKDFINNYDYHPHTDLLSSFTAPDGQTTNYTYDEFLRLDSINARNKKQATKFEYSYQPNFITNYKKLYKEDGDDLELSYTNKQSFDGLGRPDSLIKVGYAFNGAVDVISQITYNSHGLKEKDIDPLNGEMAYTYYTDQLNRIHTLTDPMGFVTTKTYGTNASNEVNNYAANTLYKETTKDADNIETTTFTDKLGRVVMTMVKKDNNTNKTHTLYDDKSRISKIMPPGTTETDAGLIYTYTYDGADNVLSKKFPDKGLVEFVYNERNLTIAMRDENIVANNKTWLSSQYDDYGRITKQGFGVKPAIIKELLIENFYDKNDAQNTIDTSNPIYIGKLHKKEVHVLNGYNASNNVVSSTYALDDYGRIVGELKTNHLNEVEGFLYTYNMADQTLQTTHTYDNNTTIATNEYDTKGRLKKAHYSVNGATAQIAEMTDYSLKDELLSKTIGNNAQTLDYSFNANGWLTKINDGYTTGNAVSPICTPQTDCANIDSEESNRSQNNQALFALDIRYNNPTYGNARKNGNIAEIHWQVKGKQKDYYNFTYDFLNRLKTANNLNNKYNTTYSYDARGNIETLTRKGLIANDCCFNKKSIDNLTYTYYPGTNRLKHITDAVATQACPSQHHQGNTTNQSGSYGAQIKLSSDAQLPQNTNINFSAGEAIELKGGFETKGGELHIATNGCPTPNLANSSTSALALSSSYGYTAYTAGNTTFEYDANGNLITDNAKGLNIHYNHLNLPYKVIKDENNTIEWLYTADGQKLQKKTTLNGTTNIKDYLGNMELYNKQLQSAYHNEGRYVADGQQWEYYLKDHLGNVRIVFTENNGMVDIVQENHYYPFGMQMNGNWHNKQNVKNDYLYNSKELNTDLGLNWSDYGFRFYDAAIGRFTGVDPISDQFAWVSTYNYAENEPIAGIDLWGLQRAEFNTYSDPGVQAYLKEKGRSSLTSEEYTLFNGPSAEAGKIGLGVGLGGGIIGAVRHFGMKVVGLFLLQEAAETGFEAATGIPVLLDPIDLMQQGLKKTGKTVLGHVEDNYQDLAKELDASVFHFDDEVWDQMVEQGVDMTKLNIDFLDKVIKQGDDIVLTRANKDIRPNSALRTEVDYLLDNGYKWANDSQTTLIPK